MEQVLINLITNSMYALEGHNRTFIKILAFDNRSRVILHVEDNGKGISYSQLENIFKPFYHQDLKCIFVIVFYFFLSLGEFIRKFKFVKNL